MFRSQLSSLHSCTCGNEGWCVIWPVAGGLAPGSAPLPSIRCGLPCDARSTAAVPTATLACTPAGSLCAPSACAVALDALEIGCRRRATAALQGGERAARAT